MLGGADEFLSGSLKSDRHAARTRPTREHRHMCLFRQSRPLSPTIISSAPYARYAMDPYYNNGGDINPYYKPYAGPSYPIPGASSSHQAPVPANAYEYDVGILAQQSVYVPGAAIDKRGGAGGKLAKGGKRTTVLRKGGGKVWEDQTLLEWNPCELLCYLRVSRC